MARQVQSLWPEAIRSNIPSPYAMLRTQADALAEQTGGLLVGEVRRREAADDRVAMSLDIVVPALDGARFRILTVGYGKEMVYPAVLDAEVFRNSARRRKEPGVFLQTATFQVPESLRKKLDTNRAELQESAELGERADSDRELYELIAKVLKSPQVVSLAQSLIARVNDISPADDGLPGSQAPPGPNTADASDDATEGV